MLHTSDPTNNTASHPHSITEGKRGAVRRHEETRTCYGNALSRETFRMVPREEPPSMVLDQRVLDIDLVVGWD